MKIVKMSLANMQGKMSRLEMKGIMAGRAADGSITIRCGDDSAITCSCSGSCACNGYDFYYTRCTDNNNGAVLCSQTCPNFA